jgi:hypothetical protein
MVYWLMFVSGMFCLLAGFPLVASFFVNSPGAPTAGQIVLQTWRVFWPALFASGLMLPILILDVIRVSHRFVGPMCRLRNAMRDVADGKSVPSLRFRKGDFWFDLAEDFNRAAARLNVTTTAANPAAARTVSQTVVEDHCATV